MSIFSALKKVTGKSAEVDLTIDGAVRGAKAKVTVDVHVGSDAVKAKRVYVTLRCNEVIDLPRYSTPAQAGAPAGSSTTIHVKSDETVFNQEFVIAEGPDLPAGATTQFTGEIDIPANQLPTLIGRNVKVQWHAFAALDVAWATDPSSAVKEITVT